MNDIINCSNILNFAMYADDTCVYLSNSNLITNVNSVNNELVKVVEWVRWNGLTLNTSKCHYLLFPRSRRKLPDNIPDVFLNNSILDRLSSTRYVGVYLDDNLNWNAHVGYVSRKLSRYIPVMFKVRQCLTRESLKLLYNSLIYPHLIYCNTVWGSARNSHIASLINIQKKIIRILLFA